MSRGALPATLLPPALWLAVFLVVPTAVLAAAAFSPEGVRHLADPGTLRLLLRSVRIAAETTLLCLVIGYPVAAFMAQASPRARAALLFLVVLPFWTNLIVRTYALIFLLRPAGLLYSETAVVTGLVHGYVPFMILPVYGALEKIPPRLREAAQDLGASPFAVFREVTLPLSLPGVAAGAILVFIPVLGAFATPELMGGARVPMVGSEINAHFVRARDVAAGSALSLVLMTFAVVLTWIYHRVRRTEGIV